MEGLTSVIAGLAAVLVLIPLAFVAYVNAGGSYRATQHFLGARKVDKREKASSLTCSVDADCPQGQVCVDGRCVPLRS